MQEGNFERPRELSLSNENNNRPEIMPVIRDASELPIDKLDELMKKFNVVGVRIVMEDLAAYQVEPYTVEEYRRCREIIDELLDGIAVESRGRNREKKAFGKVIKRLAHHIKYDCFQIKQEHRVEDRIREINLELSTVVDADKRETLLSELRNLQLEKEAMDVNAPRNLVGGLINGVCVCAGYAEIVRNVFACLGIEVRYISGINPGERYGGHAWNQIKLDGVWYNMDLTGDRDRIVAGKEPKFLLLSDEEFKKTHGIYAACRTPGEERCGITIPQDIVHGYLNGTDVKQERTPLTLLLDILKQCTMHKVQEMGTAMLCAADRSRVPAIDRQLDDR